MWLILLVFAKALELSLAQLEKDQTFIRELRSYCLNELLEHYGNIIKVNSAEDGLYTVLNVSFPQNEKTDILQMALDMKGICVSGGSACSSGAAVGSHVINHINPTANVPLRVSFSKHNTKAEIDTFIIALKELLA